jgi:hypothetical protein
MQLRWHSVGREAAFHDPIPSDQIARKHGSLTILNVHPLIHVERLHVCGPVNVYVDHDPHAFLHRSGLLLNLSAIPRPSRVMS